MTYAAARGGCPACGWQGAIKRDGTPFKHWPPGKARGAGDDPCPGTAPADGAEQ